MKKLFLLVALIPGLLSAAEQNKAVVKVDLNKVKLVINRQQYADEDECEKLEEVINILRWRRFDFAKGKDMLERLTTASILAQKDAQVQAKKEIEALQALLNSSHVSEDRKEGEGSN